MYRFLLFLFFLLIIHLGLAMPTPEKIVGGSPHKLCCDTDPAPIPKSQVIKLIKLHRIDKDTKFLYEVMSNPSIRMIIYFDRSINHGGKFLYDKQITNITEQHGRNIFYQLAVMNNYSITKYPKKDDYRINIYFVDKNTPHKEIHGTIITKNYYNTVIGAKLMLNENSLNILKYQDLDRFNAHGMKDSRSMMNTFINIVHKNIPLIEQEEMLCVHGFISYYLGLRPMQDIDCNINTSRLSKVFSEFNWIDLMDLRKISKPTQRLLSYNNIPDVNTLLHNPKNYMYVLGIKCISLDINMRQRYIRQRPKAVSEIITFNVLNSKTYPVPPIPDQYILSSDSSSQIMSLKIKEFKLTGKLYPVDKKKFLNVILYYLKSIYKIYRFDNAEELQEYITTFG